MANTSLIPLPSRFFYTKQFLKGNNPRNLTIPSVDLLKKWIIVTGGNSGIGREAALQFAAWGANVVLGCRQPPPHEPHPDAVLEECKAAALAAGHEGTIIEWWEVDMASLASIGKLADRWLDTKRPLDVLCNNAGIGGYVGKVRKTEDGFELLHQVNFMSHVFLTMKLLPALAEARSPRIICTISNMHYLGVFDLPNNVSVVGVEAYKHNKLYFQTWLTALQNRMSASEKYKHITIQGVHPGWIASNIWILPQDATLRAKITGIVSVWLGSWGISTQQGSLAITNAATAPEAGSDLVELQEGGAVVGKGGGRFFNRIWDEVPMPQTKSPEAQRQVWEYVVRELKLQEKGLLGELGA